MYQDVFDGSRILKRQIDRVIAYLNLPSDVIDKYLFPTRIFPSTMANGKLSKDKFPQLSKVINYFQSK